LPEDLDFIDLQILDTLQSDARLSVVDLTRKVKLSTTPCTLGMRKLEQDGAIFGYHAHFNPSALNQALTLFVSVSLKATDEASLKAFNAAVKPGKQILECHMLGGRFACLLKIRLSDRPEYREILGSIFGALPVIKNTHSYFVMDEDKPKLNLPIPRN
jgi:Lrp/AsnC family leucine-responsive transcriptional regulator